MTSVARRRALEEENAWLRERLRALEPSSAGAPGLSVALLGPPRVTRIHGDAEGREIPWRLRRARRALALLALAPGCSATRQDIVHALWPDADAAKVRRNLHPTLHELRRSLGEPSAGVPALVSVGGVYALNPALEWRIDVVEFDRHSRDGRQALARDDQRRAVGEWTQALELYRGHFLAGDDDPWVEERRETYRERRLGLLHALGALYERQGDLERALDAYRLSLAEEALQEDLHVAVLRVYARQGRRDLVRRHFDRFSRLLVEELGVQPSAHAASEYQRLMTSSGDR